MKSFSELTSASQVNNGDLLAISQTSGSGYASKKTTVKDITDKSNLNLAEEYDSTSTYAVDDYVIYESVLYKCIASTTGTFDSTKWTSVVVTDEMGSGGGGTGGHTIIDENGTSMSARAGLQFVGGANVSDDSTNNKTIVDLASAGGIDGVFIDAENVITTLTGNNDMQTYTATEDCVVAGTFVGTTNNTPALLVDGVTVAYTTLNQTMGAYVCLKKGQVLSYRMASTGTNLKVYGIQTGTTHSKFQPVIYSTEERVIGVWTDGKPLYEKTLYTNTQVQLNNTAWTTIPWVNEPTDVDFLVSAEITRQCPNHNNTLRFTLDDGHIKGACLQQANYPPVSGITEYLKVRYTKSTDVAGSGSWTPQGVPAVHYSTDEQIIGTYFGNTLYQKTIVLASDVSIADSWTTIYTDALIGNISQLVDVKYNNVDNKGVYGVLNYKPNGNNLQAVYPISGGINVLAGAKFTLQYTKTS